MEIEKTYPAKEIMKLENGTKINDALKDNYEAQNELFDKVMEMRKEMFWNMMSAMENAFSKNEIADYLKNPKI